MRRIHLSDLIGKSNSRVCEWRQDSGIGAQRKRLREDAAITGMYDAALRY